MATRVPRVSPKESNRTERMNPSISPINQSINFIFVGELRGFENFKIELKNKIKIIVKIVTLLSLFVSTQSLVSDAVFYLHHATQTQINIQRNSCCSQCCRIWRDWSSKA